MAPRKPKALAPAKPWANRKAEARAARAPIAESWILKADAAILADCHDAGQRDFVEDLALFISALVGRGGGKTTGGRARFARRMIWTPNAKCLYFAETRDAAEDLMWEPMKRLFERLGLEATWAEARLRVTLRANNAQLRLVGADDKREIDKHRGKPHHEVIVDESASFKPALLDNLVERVISPRLGDYNGVMCLIGTPGHDLRGPFYDATRPGSEHHRPYSKRNDPEYADWIGWSSHAWSLTHPEAQKIPALQNLWKRALITKAKNKWSDQHPVWMREYLGIWASDGTLKVFQYAPHAADGSSWNQWDPEREGPYGFAKLPLGPDEKPRTDWAHIYALDNGHADPFALNIYAVSPSDPSRTIYHRYGFEKTGMYAKPIAQLMLGEELKHTPPAGLIGVTGWPDGAIADADDATLLELANVYGIRITKAEKQANYKKGATELVNGDFLDGRIKILKGSALEEQLIQLEWVEDQYGVLSENKAMANHSTDTLVYARRLIAAMFESGQGEQTSAVSKPAPSPLYADPQGLAEPSPDLPVNEDSLLLEPNYEHLWGNT